MTSPSQTSVISTRPFRHSQKAPYTYSVIVNEEDGSYQEFEVEASSFAEAEVKANEIAQETMTDITFIEIYKLS